MNINEKIKALREIAGLTQTELAEKAGMTQPMIARFEQSGSISTSNLLKITKALGYTLEFKKTNNMKYLTFVGLRDLRERVSKKAPVQYYTKKDTSGYFDSRVTEINPCYFSSKEQMIEILKEELKMPFVLQEVSVEELDPLNRVISSELIR